MNDYPDIYGGVEKNGVFVVVGPPGIGKSMFARTRDFEKVLIDVRNLAEDDVHQKIALTLNVSKSIAGEIEHSVPIVLDNLSADVDWRSIRDVWAKLSFVVTSVDQAESDSVFPGLDASEIRQIYEAASGKTPSTELVESFDRNPLAAQVVAGWTTFINESEVENVWRELAFRPGRLRDSFEISWGQLGPVEQSVLRFAALFPNAVPLTFWTDDGTSLSVFDELENNGWFSKGGLLHEPARAYIRTMNLDPEKQRLTKWLLTEMTEVEREFISTSEWECVERFQASVGLVSYALQNGYFDDRRAVEIVKNMRNVSRAANEIVFHREQVKRILETVPDDGSSEYVMLRAFELQAIGDVTRAEAIAGLRELDTVGLNPRDMGVYDNLLGTFLHHEGETEEGTLILTNARQRAVAAGDFGMALFQNVGLVRTCIRSADYDAALEHAQFGYSIAEMGNLGRYRRVAALWLGAVYMNRNDTESAIKNLTEAARDEPSILFRLVALGNLALTLMRDDRSLEASRVFEELLEFSFRVQSRQDVGLSYGALALCYFDQRRDQEASIWIDKALDTLAGYPLSSTQLLAFAVKISVSVDAGTMVEPWLSKLRNAPPEKFVAFSKECVEAIVERKEFEPTNGIEAMLTRRNASKSTTVDREKRMVTIGDETHDFSRRKPAWNIMICLLESQSPVSAWDLAELAWPNEKLSESHMNRLYATVSRLRKQGFEIESSDDGYRLQASLSDQEER